MAATLIQNLALFILRQTFDHWPAVPLSVTVVVFHFVKDRVKAWGAWTNKFRLSGNLPMFVPLLNEVLIHLKWFAGFLPSTVCRIFSSVFFFAARANTSNQKEFPFCPKDSLFHCTHNLKRSPKKNKHIISRPWSRILIRWWFETCFFIFAPIPGKMIQFDWHFSNGLVQPPTRIAWEFKLNHQVFLGKYTTSAALLKSFKLAGWTWKDDVMDT